MPPTNEKAPAESVRSLCQGQLQALGAMEIVRADTQRTRYLHVGTATLNNSCTGTKPGPDHDFSGEMLSEVLVHLEHAHLVLAAEYGPKLLIR